MPVHGEWTGVKISVDVWSDFACPWCYVGKRRFEAARASFAGDVDLRWRAFELSAGAPRRAEPDRTYAERLAHKYGTSVARGQEMIRTMTAAGAASGVELRFDLVQPGNTFDAHRLVRWAAARGRAGEVAERLFRATWTEGEAIGEPDVLIRLATELDFDPSEVSELFAADALAAEVRADEREARERGVHGVPYFLVDGRVGLSGAQEPAALLDALRRA